MREPDTTVKCAICGREEKARFSVCLRLGWPRCCDFSMTIIRQPAPVDIELITRDVVEEQYRA